MSSTAGSQQSVWISAMIFCPLSNQSLKRTTQGKRGIKNLSALNKNSPYSLSWSYFEHLKCWKIRKFLVVIFCNLTHASNQSLKITSHTFSFKCVSDYTSTMEWSTLTSYQRSWLVWCDVFQTGVPVHTGSTQRRDLRRPQRLSVYLLTRVVHQGHERSSFISPLIYWAHTVCSA